MPDPGGIEKLAAEVARIDSQMAALAKLKQKHLTRISDAESPENQMTMEERRKELVEAFAEGIVYLGQNGLLPLNNGQGKPEIMLLARQPLKTQSPNEKRLKGRK